MKDIIWYIDTIWDELDGAKCYAKMYQSFRNSDSVKSKMFYDMSQNELHHASELYNIVTAMTEEFENSEASHDCVAMMWDAIESKYLDKVANVKTMLTM